MTDLQGVVPLPSPQLSLNVFRLLLQQRQLSGELLLLLQLFLSGGFASACQPARGQVLKRLRPYLMTLPSNCEPSQMSSSAAARCCGKEAGTLIGSNSQLVDPVFPRGPWRQAGRPPSCFAGPRRTPATAAPSQCREENIAQTPKLMINPSNCFFTKAHSHPWTEAQPQRPAERWSSTGLRIDHAAAAAPLSTDQRGESTPARVTGSPWSLPGRA